MINRKIYIKGVCDYARERKGAYAVIVTHTIGGKEEYIYANSQSYDKIHSNFAAEIEGITDALEHIDAQEPVDVFTNNQALVAILSEERYGYEYKDELHRYWDLARNRDIVINWTRKSENNKWMQNATMRANELLT